MNCVPLISLFVFLGSTLGKTADTDTPAIAGVSRSIHDSAMTCLIHQEYGSARMILQNHLMANPHDFKASYLLFTVEWTRILDYESYIVDEKRFQLMADSLKRMFETSLKTLHGADSTNCVFYIANIYGGIAVVQAKTGNWFDGVKNAINSFSMLKEVKKKEPAFHAADFGLGIFGYHLRTGLKWLPFLEDKADEGLETMESALKAEFPYSYAAKNSLCWILIEQNNFRRADSLAQSVLNDYPNNTIFLRIKAFIELWTGHYENAVECAERLLALAGHRQPQNWPDLISGYVVLVQGFDALNRNQDACIAARTMIDLKLPQEYRRMPHIKKYVKCINGILQKSIKEKG